jgi:hypothetical protein
VESGIPSGDNKAESAEFQKFIGIFFVDEMERFVGVAETLRDAVREEACFPACE